MTAIAMPVHTPLEQAREDVARYQELHDGLRNGTRDWREFCDAYTCGDRTGKAIEECYETLRQAQERVAALTGAAA